MNDLQKTSALTDSDIKTLEQAGIIPSGTPAAQISVFAATCKERGLSPFTKEVYLVGYGGKYSIITGINGFRKIASESREHAGTDDVIFNLKPDGTYKTAADLKSAAEKPTTATCTVYRIVSGVRCPFTHTAVFSEFASARNPKWNEMPFQMKKRRRWKALRLRPRTARTPPLRSTRKNLRRVSRTRQQLKS
jgi:hypothetical protein